jgi:hypothetical protein
MKCLLDFLKLFIMVITDWMYWFFCICFCIHYLFLRCFLASVLCTCVHAPKFHLRSNGRFNWVFKKFCRSEILNILRTCHSVKKGFFFFKNWHALENNQCNANFDWYNIKYLENYWPQFLWTIFEQAKTYTFLVMPTNESVCYFSFLLHHSMLNTPQSM